MKILFISLGCDKNLVDTEVMLGLLASRGYEMTDDETKADTTCASARPVIPLLRFQPQSLIFLH